MLKSMIKAKKIHLFSHNYTSLQDLVLIELMTMARQSAYGVDPLGQSGLLGIGGVSRSGVSQKLEDCLVLDGLNLSLAKSLSDTQALRDYWMQYLPTTLNIFPGIYEWAESCMRLVINEVEDYISRIQELQTLYGLSPMTLKETVKLRSLYTMLSCRGVMVKEFKVAVNFIFAAYFGTQKPERSFFDLRWEFLPGCLARYMRRKASTKRKSYKLKVCSLFYTLFQGLKKGLLPIRPDQVDASLLDHRKALTKCPDLDRETLKSLDELLKESFPELRRVWGASNRMRKPLLSNKATVDCSMGRGGQVGFALEGNPVLGSWDIKRCQDLTDSYLTTYSLSFSRTTIIGHYSSRITAWEDIRYGQCFFDESTLRSSLGWFKYGRGSPLVQPSVVLEPLKGRIITKPRAGDYRDLGHLQKSLWSAIESRREFALTGRPVCVEDIYFVLGRDWQSGWGINSGDFSGATDNLKGALCELILDYLLEESDISLEDQVCIKQSFLKSQIDYRKIPIPTTKDSFAELYQHWKCTDMGTVQQTNGQLMGHLLSFPILCIANYLIFRLVYKRMNVPEPNVLVNGDDILFTCSPGVYENWCKTTSECGFFPSLGKNLFSDKVAQINSVLFRVDTALVPGTEDTFFVRNVCEIPYYNFGLLTKRGKGRTGDDQSNVQRLTNDKQRLSVIMDIRRELVDNLIPIFGEKPLKVLFKKHYYFIMKEFELATGLNLLEIPNDPRWKAFFSSIPSSINTWGAGARENSHIRMLSSVDKCDLDPFENMKERSKEFSWTDDRGVKHFDIYALEFWFIDYQFQKNESKRPLFLAVKQCKESGERNPSISFVKKHAWHDVLYSGDAQDYSQQYTDQCIARSCLSYEDKTRLWNWEERNLISV